MSDSDLEFGFEGVTESPIPDMFGGEPETVVGGGADDASESPPEVQHDSVTASPPVQHPEPRGRNYDSAAASGARQGRMQQVQQGYSQPGQSVVGSVAQGVQGTGPGQTQGATQTGGAQPGEQKPRQRPPLPGVQPGQQPGRMQQPGQFTPEQIESLKQMGLTREQYNWVVTNHLTYDQAVAEYRKFQAQQQAMMDAQAAQAEQGGKKGKVKKQKAPKPPKQPKAVKSGSQGGPVVPGSPGSPGGPGSSGGSGSPGVTGSGKPAKKLSIIPIIIGVVALIVIGVLAIKLLGGKGAQEPMQYDYATSGRWALDTLQSAINTYDPSGIDGVVGTEDGDSYLAQEWAYVNNVKIRQEFLQKVGALVKFEYPKVQQMSTSGEVMVDEAGNPIMIESYMNNGEEMVVTIPDYDKISKTMDEKSEYILKMLESAKYSENDYTWVDELTNLMIQFVLDDGPIPTKTVKVTVPIRMNTAGQPYIESDAVIDDLLFGSEEFHAMCAKFSQICVGWTGHIEEVYVTYERRHNEEYDRWLELFLAYFEADGGVYNPDAAEGEPMFTNVQKAFKRNKSKWEPWYLRDDNNVIQKYPDGTFIVNYFTVKDENGNDWIQPAIEVEVEVENTRLLDDPWVEETGIWYNWCGLHFLETYTGPGSVVTRVGDGSREHPAGVGTTIITKVLCTDGMYHDVKVALMGYWTGQSAIDYAEKFSNRNRGFTTASVVQLICYEIYVENLEEAPIEFESSEMTLTDRNSNISSRTGTMYGFSGVVRLEGRGDKQGNNKTIINDWATSTELAQKYVCWGKSFGRKFSMVYFDCLAGTGEIPPYSAYKQFTGQSSIDEDIKS